MKNSHCRDPKMEAYCDEVWRLEDKFFGLELNHIARRYNETADELAKIASGRILAVRRQSIPESGQFDRGSLAHQTLSGAPPDSPVPQTERLYTANSPLFFFFLFLILRQVY